MYSADDSAAYQLAAAGTPRRDGNAGGAAALARCDSDEISPACGLLFPAQNGQTAAQAEALAQVLVARERRKAAEAVAECMVRIKEIDATADVRKVSLSERGRTERCEIVEEQRSRRYQRFAEVATTAVREGAETTRLAAQGREETKREALAVHARVETLRIEAAQRSAGFWRLVLAAFSGALAARFLHRRARGRLQSAGAGARWPWLLAFAAAVFLWRRRPWAASDFSWRGVLQWLLWRLWHVLQGEKRAPPPTVGDRTD
eukprot:TRINITY_DN13063_c0_g1_i1.p1 TRINITY_DN13063_c0_g1~~TRINITY_DN13063_c0_g1_i1.p1  ORF type:complete len:261 (-),score=44.46 TRINITY_DN13063_c0_g1_i1:79-861(-)